MTKSELVAKMAREITELPEKDLADSVYYILELMTESLAHGKRIEIRGFGSFSTRFRSSRPAHNPRTKAKMTTAGRYGPRFKPGKELREKVNANRHLPIHDGNPDESLDVK